MILFRNRIDAGVKLARELSVLKPDLKDPIVLGIPRGGVPVGYCIATDLKAPLDTIVLRKLPIPHNPEAGFGAVTLDKVAIFNEELLSAMDISKPEMNRIIENVYREVLRRNQVYRDDKLFPLLDKRSVILTDDGLATGFTMLAAIKFVKKRKAGQIIAAVPVAHRDAYDLVKKESDKTVVLHISDDFYFAVASFYKEFPDMSDRDVVSYLENSGPA